MAIVVLGIIAMAFWPKGNAELVSLTVSAVSSDRVLLTMTNSLETSIQYMVFAYEVAPDYNLPLGIPSGNLAGHSTTNFSFTVPTTNRWKVHLMYSGHTSAWSATGLRQNLADLVDDLGLKRASEWLEPMIKEKDIYGPLMLGNEPLAEGRK